MRVGERVPLQRRGFGNQDECLDRAHRACCLAEPLLPLVDVRIIPNLGSPLFHCLEGFVRKLSELGRRSRDVNFRDACGGNMRGAFNDAFRDASRNCVDFSWSACNCTRDEAGLVGRARCFGASGGCQMQCMTRLSTNSRVAVLVQRLAPGARHGRSEDIWRRAFALYGRAATVVVGECRLFGECSLICLERLLESGNEVVFKERIRAV